MSRYLPLSLLLLVIATLVGSNVYMFANPRQSTPIMPSDVTSIKIPEEHETVIDSPADQSMLIHTQTRPLFSPSRRIWIAAEPEAVVDPILPEPVVAEVAVVVEAQPPPVTLIGVQKTSANAMALLLKTGTSDAIWISPGETIDQWTVKSVDSTSVELVDGNQTVKLELYPTKIAVPASEQP